MTLLQGQRLTDVVLSSRRTCRSLLSIFKKNPLSKDRWRFRALELRPQVKPRKVRYSAREWENRELLYSFSVGEMVTHLVLTESFGIAANQFVRSFFEAACLMDSIECKTMITAARHNSRMSTEQMLNLFDVACQQFSQDAEVRFSRRGKFR